MGQNSISNIPVQVFAAYIVEKLHRDNPFLKHAVNESAHVLGGAVVHIPNAGPSPTVVRNRKQFPAVAVQRQDSAVTYALNTYTTDPTYITWHEENEISYDKTDSVLREHVASLIEAIGDDILVSWLKGLKNGGLQDDIIPSSSIIKTTGNAVVGLDGQTGQRKAMTLDELQNAQAIMDKQGIPESGRYCILESFMYQQLIKSLSTNEMAAFQQTADLSRGVLGQLAGFYIMKRGEVAIFTEDGNPKDSGLTIDGTDNIASICWHEDCVAEATGDIVPFSEKGSPSYYGDVVSALVKGGGRCRRADWKGVLAIVQDVIPTTPAEEK